MSDAHPHCLRSLGRCGGVMDTTAQRMNRVYEGALALLLHRNGKDAAVFSLDSNGDRRHIHPDYEVPK